jgi:hypothetical protein
VEAAGNGEEDSVVPIYALGSAATSPPAPPQPSLPPGVAQLRPTGPGRRRPGGVGAGAAAP